MTSEYMYNEMTWNEISDALDYVHMYECNEKHYAIKPYQKNKKLNEWWGRNEIGPEKALRDFVRNVKVNKAVNNGETR
jgi:hypothetical protein